MDLKHLDKRFSLLVRERAQWTCALCHRYCGNDREILECSHFHSRRHKSVRFDPDNCAALCWKCHRYMDMHPLKYAEWKKEKLGEERYNALYQRMQMIVKVDTKEISVALTELEAA